MKRKVFGIGFQKTATTSLAVALYTLGYNVTGYFGAYDPEIGEKVHDIAYDLADRFDAAQDTPWPLLYKALDERYPGSKFILTVRAPEKWIRSVVRHFQDQYIPLHEWVYGVRTAAGNEDVYLERFKRHNAEVQAYFRDRPDDLLVMDITKGDGWEKLCPFLGVDIPPFGFPNMNTFRQRNRLFDRLGRFLRRHLALPTSHGVSAAVARDLVHYHYGSFGQLWACLEPVSEAAFRAPGAGTGNSIRRVMSDQIAEETAWLRQLAVGTAIAEQLPPETLPDTKEALYQYWHDNMRLMRLFAASLTNEDANRRVGEQRATVWEVLFHFVSTGVERQTRLQSRLEAEGIAYAPPSFIHFFRGS